MSRFVPCGRTEGHDETNSSFSQFCEPAQNNSWHSFVLQQFGADMAVTFHAATHTKEINGCSSMGVNSNVIKRNRTRHFTGSYQLPAVSKAIRFLPPPKHCALFPQNCMIYLHLSICLNHTSRPYPLFTN